VYQEKLVNTQSCWPERLLQQDDVCQEKYVITQCCLPRIDIPCNKGQEERQRKGRLMESKKSTRERMDTSDESI
jgi:hypothetical protein